MCDVSYLRACLASDKTSLPAFSTIYCVRWPCLNDHTLGPDEILEKFFKKGNFDDFSCKTGDKKWSMCACLFLFF